MAWWKSLGRQRGWVKAHEAKAIGHYARKAEDRQTIIDGLNEANEEND